MNKVFRVIWNHATQTWVAVSELTQAKGKTKSSSTAKAAAAAVAIAAATVSGAASAATTTSQPAGTNAGNVYVSTSDNQTMLGKNIEIGNDTDGTGVEYKDTTTVAIGTNLKSDAKNGIVIGDNVRSLRQVNEKNEILAGDANTVAIGFNLEAKPGSVVIGSGSKSLLNNGVAIGVNAETTFAHAVAIGTGAKAAEYNTAALGKGALATEQYAFALGAEAKATAKEATAIGSGATVEGRESVAIGIASHAKNGFSVAIGRAKTYNDQAIAIGYQSHVDTGGQGGIAIGRGAYSNNGHAIAMGTSASAKGLVSLAIGQQAHANGKFASSYGIRAYAHSERSGAFGAWSQIDENSTNAHAIGTKNTLNNVPDTYVLGGFTTPTQSNSVILGNKSADRAATVENAATVNGISYEGFAGNKDAQNVLRTDGSAGIVSVGSAGGERQIINVAPGKIAADSTDAINGSQLYLTQHALGNVAKTTANHLGGGSTVNPDGNLTAPSYELVVGNPQAGENKNLAGQNPATNPVINTAVKPATNVGDALGNLNAYINKGFDIRENGTDANPNKKATVTPGEAVNFVNGTGTKASVTNETTDGVTDITFNVDFGTITNKVDGKAFTPDTDANAPKVASTKMVEEAINNSGFNLKVDKATGAKNSKATDGGTKLVKPGEEVVFKAGDNIELTRSGKEITIKSNPKFSIATADDGSKQISSGDTIQFAASDDGLADFKLDTGSGTIKPQLKKLATVPIINTNTDPKMGAVRTQGTNAIADHLVTGQRLAEAVNNSYWRANINKVGSGDADPATNDAQIKAGDKVEFIAGNGMKIEIDESNRQFTFSLKTDDIPAPETATLTVTTTPDGQNGNVNTVPDTDKNKLVTAGNVAEVINQSGWNLAGKGADGTTDVATTVNPSDKVSFKNSDTANVVIDTTDKANPTVTVNVNTTKLTNNANGNVDAPTVDEGKKLVNADTVAKAINDSGWKVTSGTEDTGEQAGTKEEVLVKPAEVVSLKAGKNMKIKQTGKDFVYSTKDNVVFTDVNTETLTIGGPKGKPGATTPADKPRADISVVNGPTDLAGQPNTEKTRIQYTPVNPDGTPGTPENLATLKDGLKFKGNDATKVISKPLNSTLSVEGALPANTEASAKNVRVDVEGTGDDAKLVVKIAEKPEFKGVTLKDGQDPAAPNTVNLNPTAPNTLTLTGGDNAAPVTIANVKDNLPGTTVEPTASATNRTMPANADAIKKNAATVNDVLNAGFNVKVNNADVDFVKAYDTVEFVNGDGTTVEHVQTGKSETHNKIKVSVNKGTLAAVEDNNTPNKPKGSLKTDDVAAQGDKFATTNQIVDAVNKSGWNIAGKNANGQAADGLVNPGDKVTFGSSDTADIALDVTNADNPTVTVNVKTAEIGQETKTDPANPQAQPVPTGKVELTTKPNATDEEKAAEGKKLVNADTVVNAINNAGFTATVGTDTAADKLTFANEAGKADALINPGDKVVYQAGKNMKVKQEQDGNTTKFTYATEDNVHFNSVTVQTEADGKAGSPITMVSLPSTDDADNTNTLAFLGRDPQDQTKTAPVKIVNVESGLKPYAAPNAAENPAPFKAAEGLINLNTPNIDDSNVVTAGDLRKMGWVVATPDNQYEQAVKNAQKVDFKGNGGINVNGKTVADGHYEVEISLAEAGKLKLEEIKNAAGSAQGQSTPSGRVSVEGDNANGFVGAKNVADMINGSGFKATIGRDDAFFADQAGKADELINPGDTVTLQAGDNLKVKQDTKDGVTKFTFATKENVEFSTVKVATKVRDENTGDVVAEGSPITLVSLPSTDDVDNTNTLAFMGTTPDGKKPAPVTLTNIKSNLPDAYNKGDKVIGEDGYPTNDDAAAPTKSVTGPTAVEAAEMHNKAATVGDVLNAGFNIQANGKEADFVKPYDTVNFADGTGTTVEFVPSEDGKVNTIKINTVMAYTDENGNKVAKVVDDEGNVAYYPVDSVTGKPDTTKPAVDNPQVNVVNADGTTTNPTVLGNVAAGAKTYGPNLAQPTDINSPKAVEMAKNVSAAYEGLADLNSSNPTNVMTVADAKNMGWVVSTLHGNNYAADVRNANHVDFVGTGLATVKGHTDAATGIRVITVDVNSQNVVQDAQLPVVYTNKDGDKVIKVGDKFYKDADVTVFDGNVYPKDSVVAADGKVYPAGTVLGDNNLPTDNTVAAIDPLADGDKVVDPNTIIASMNNGDNDTKVPMQLANVGANLPNTYNAGDKAVVDANGKEVIGGKPTGAAKGKDDVTKAADLKDVDVEKVFNNAATVGDVLNSGWNLQANGEAADFVKPYDTVNFADGTGTTVEFVPSEDGKVNTIKINTVMAYTDENGNKVAKADDDKFYPVNPATGKPDTTKPAVENPQVNVVNADGTTTNPTVLGNVAAGAKVFGPDLAKPTNDTPEAKEMAKNVSAAYEGLANLDASNPTNVMTVADAKNMGWVVSTLHGNGYADDVRNANHVDFVGTGLATVKGHTDAASGIRVITVDVNAQNVVQDAQLPVVYTDKDGNKVVKVGDKFYKDGDITVVNGNVYPKDSVVAADGQVYPAGTTLNDKGLPNDSNVAAIQPLPENNDKVVAPADIIASMNNGDNSTAEPMPLANVLGTLKQVTPQGQVNNPDGKKAADAAPANLKQAPNTAAEIDAFHNDPNVMKRAATVGDVLNTGFNLQGNGQAADFVRHGDTVNFADGTGTTVEVETSADGKTNTIKVNTVMAYTDSEGNKVAKVVDDEGNVAYYPVDPETGKPDTTKPAVENPQVNVVNADGTTTNPTVLGNVAAGAKTYGPNLAKPTNDTPEAKEMAKNVSDAYNGLANLDASNPTNVMTVADAKNMGWVVSTLHGNGYADDVRNANHVDFVGTGLATVKGHTDAATGIRVITVDVNAQNVVQDAQLPVVYTNKDGDKVVKVGDKFYKDGDITVVNGNVYPKDSVVAADGQVYPAGTTLNDKGLPNDSNVAAIQPLPENNDKVVAPADIIASMNNGDNSTAEPMTLANVGGNLPNTYNKGDKTVVGADGQEAIGGKPTGAAKAKADKEANLDDVDVEKVFNNAATVGDVLNSGFNVQANGEAADFVKPYDTVNFVDGKGTLASVETDDEGKVTNVTFNVDTGKVTATGKGDVTGPVKAAEEALKAAKDALAQDPDNQDLKDAVTKAEGDVVKAGNQVATAQNVADAINNSGWNIKGTDENGEAFTKLVKPGSQVSFQDGKGTKAITDVDSEGNPFVRIDIDADKVAENISKGDISVINEGDKAGTVAPKAGDENKLVTAKEVADAINGSGWKATIGRDDSYFVDQAGQAEQLIKPGETVTFNSGKNLKVKQDGNNITYDLADDLDIHTANIGGPGKDGKPGKDGSVNVKAEDGKSGVAIDGKDASVTASGKDGASVAINGQDGSIGLQGPKGDDGKDGLGATLKIGAGPAGVDGKDGFDGIPGKDGENGKPRIVYTPIDPATGKPAVDENGDPVEEKVATLNDGLKFVGNDGKEVVKKLNETLAIKGGLDNNKPASAKNVRVDNENGELIVKIAEKPEFTGVTVKDGDNVVNFNTTEPNTLKLGGTDNAAVTIANVKGNLPDTYNADAVNTGNKPVTKSQELPQGVENKVNNAATVGDVLNAGFNLQANGEAADFVKPYDTVNFADGKNTKVRIDSTPDGKVNTVRVDVDLEPLNKRIGDVEKEGRAGIAGATAMTNLPQVTLPGASMVAAGVGHYKGQSALAIGVSRLSDGGNWIVKAQASANTKGDFNVGAGIGYQWR